MTTINVEMKKTRAADDNDDDDDNNNNDNEDDNDNEDEDEEWATILSARYRILRFLNFFTLLHFRDYDTRRWTPAQIVRLVAATVYMLLGG